MFGGYSRSGNRDTMVLVCYVTLEDHVIKASSDYGKKPLKVSHHLTKFDDHNKHSKISK